MQPFVVKKLFSIRFSVKIKRKTKWFFALFYFRKRILFNEIHCTHVRISVSLHKIK